MISILYYLIQIIYKQPFFCKKNPRMVSYSNKNLLAGFIRAQGKFITKLMITVFYSSLRPELTTKQNFGGTYV